METNNRKQLLESFDKVYVYILSKEDEAKWKAFLKHYFPNHYASTLLDEDLVAKVSYSKDGTKSFESQAIAITHDGFGKISLKLAHYGGYKEIEDFEEFKITACYKAILSKGVSLEYGVPEIIKIKLK